jgi:hypothetical protein
LDRRICMKWFERFLMLHMSWLHKIICKHIWIPRPLNGIMDGVVVNPTSYKCVICGKVRKVR